MEDSIRRCMLRFRPRTDLGGICRRCRGATARVLDRGWLKIDLTTLRRGFLGMLEVNGGHYRVSMHFSVKPCACPDMVYLRHWRSGMLLPVILDGPLSPVAVEALAAFAIYEKL